MVKKSSMIGCCIILFFLSGCAFHDKQYSSQNFKPQINSGLIADLEVGNKISGTALYERILFFTIQKPHDYAVNISFSDLTPMQQIGSAQNIFSKGASIDPNAFLKSAASYSALQGTDYDYLLNPRYEITDEDYFFYKKTKVAVTGWGLKIKKFRQVEDKYLFPSLIYAP